MQRRLDFSGLRLRSALLGARVVRMVAETTFGGANMSPFVARSSWLCLVTCGDVEAETDPLAVWRGTCAALEGHGQLARVPLLALVLSLLWIFLLGIPALLLPFFVALVILPLLLLAIWASRPLTLCLLGRWVGSM